MYTCTSHSGYGANVVIPDMSGIVVVLGYQKDLYVDIQELFFDDDILKYVDIFRYFKIVTEIPDLQP
jgi:hypothetical protein